MPSNSEYLAHYDANRFRQLAHQWVDRLADYLSQMSGDQNGLVLAPIDPITQLSHLSDDFSENGQGDVLPLLEQLIAGSNHLHHPNYVGHQVSAPLPLAVLIESANALLNNGMAIYEMGPIQSAMEHRVLAFLATELGFPNSAGGVMTSGGSIGNLTALLAAHKAQSSTDPTGDDKAAILVSSQSHYCIRRAVNVMGWGDGGIETIAVDRNYRIDVQDLDAALIRVHARGRKPVAVIANAASTATGSIDPIEEIGQFCRRNKLWLHIDGAHGASFVLSPEYRSKLAGIEFADSVVWDAHKMMMMPALNTAVIFRNDHHAHQTFSQQASYLFEEHDDTLSLDLGRKTLECTKRGMGVSLYLMLRTIGIKPFRQHVTHMIELTAEISQLIDKSEDFELACVPDCNIICFRHVPNSFADQPETILNAHQTMIRRRLIQSGRFYLVQTDLDRGRFLRCTIINPLTTFSVFVDLLKAIRAISAEVENR